MPALTIGEGAFDLLFFTYKDHRARWMEEDGEEDWPHFVREGDIVCGDRLESFLQDVGRHEYGNYSRMKEMEGDVNESIRGFDKKWGRTSVVKSKQELEVEEEENRRRYLDMLRGLEVPDETIVMPVLSGILPKSKKVVFEPEVEARPESEGVFGKLRTLLNESLSSSPRKNPSKKGDEKDGGDDGGTEENKDVDVKLGNDMKGRYYYDKFKFTPLDVKKHNKLRQSYVEALVWCLNYYYKGCVSWDWFYPYHYGPMLSDLTNLQSHLQSTSFNYGSPLTPFQQLLACQPPSSSHLLPAPYHSLMTSTTSPIKDFYPTEFQVDMNGMRNPWEAVVLLPFIDTQRLLQASNTISPADLTEEERKRNRLGQAVRFTDGGNTVTPIPSSPPPSSSTPVFSPNLHPGTTIPLACFPTLTSVPLNRFARRRIYLNIFGTKSRYKTAILQMADSGSGGSVRDADGKSSSSARLPPASHLGKTLIGERVYYAYPFLDEGIVTSVRDDQGIYRGPEYREYINERDAVAFQIRKQEIYRDMKQGEGVVGSGGLIVPDGNVLLTVRPLERVDDDGCKIYETREIMVSLMAVLWIPEAVDGRFANLKMKLEKNWYEVAAMEESVAVASSSLHQGNAAQRKKKPLPFASILPPLMTSSEETTEKQAVRTVTSSTSVPSLSSSSTPILSRRLSALSPMSSQGGGTRSTNATLPKTNNGSRRQFATERALLRRRVPRGGRGSAILTAAAMLTSLYTANATTTSPPFGLSLHSLLTSSSSSPLLNDDSTFNLASSSSLWQEQHDNSDEDRNDELTEMWKQAAPPLEFSHGTTTLSFVFKTGILIAVDSRASIGNFIGSKTTQKVIPINKHILGTMAGGAADCSHTLRLIRSHARTHHLQHPSQPFSVTRAATLLSNLLYQNRHLQLSVGTMIAGFDLRRSEPVLYYIDNTGLRIGGRVFAVGSGSTLALGILDLQSQSGKEELWELEEADAVALGIKAIRGATFRDAYSGGYVGVYVVDEKGWRKVFSEDLAGVL